MSGPDVVDTETPNPPWRPRDDRGRHFFQRLSDRTPLRTKLITALLALVIAALAVISVASVYMLHGYVTTQRDTTLKSDFPIVNTNGLAPGYATPARGGSGLLIAAQNPGKPITWLSNNGYPSLGGSQGPLPVLPTSTNWASGTTPVLLTVPSTTGPDTWRIIAQTVTDYQYLGSDGQQVAQTATIILAVDIGNVNALTTRLVLFDLIVGGAIVLVLAMVGAAAVRANLRQLNDIELSAGQIAQGHLDHRVPEGDPRTEVGSLSRSLNAMLTQIERAFHAQEESEQAAHESEERMRRFIADASHELRTPLTTIRGFAAHYRMRGGAAGRPHGVNGGRGGRGGRLEDQEQSSRTDAFVPASASVFSPAGAPSEGPARAGASPDRLSPDGMPPQELDHLIARVEAEATRMGLLVEDLLTLARLDQQRPLNIAPVDVLTLAADAVQDARIVSPGRPIDLIVAPGTAFLVDGDEQRLRQVLGNLVNNAITHTPAGTPVRVKIGAGTLPPAADGRARGPASGGPASAGGPASGGPASAGGPASGGPASAGENGFAGGVGGSASASREPVPAVVLDVEDDGPGMPAEQAQRVFERFYRADAARNRASGGTGLGLAIVAGLVNAHGGTVSVRTAPGQGADFQVRLPLSPDALASSDDPDDTLPD
jgi:two-component system OmpR family sensor kinase